jgi:HEAT repeat protein
MPRRSYAQLTPRQSVEFECARRGPDEVVAGCVALLRGEQGDESLIVALACSSAQHVIFDSPRQRNQYWRRVWGARGLLYAWNDSAEDAVVAALADEHWRVREMAAKVVAKRGIGAALQPCAGLRDDPVPRVRAAALRAVVRLTAAGS